jgi:hypothetical protein
MYRKVGSLCLVSEHENFQQILKKIVVKGVTSMFKLIIVNNNANYYQFNNNLLSVPFLQKLFRLGNPIS